MSTHLTPPAWPEIDPDVRGKSFRQQIEEWNAVTGAMNQYYCDECCFIADDADEALAAALVRLRIAVDALSEIESESVSADMDNDCADETHCIAIDALAAIGELPK